MYDTSVGRVQAAVVSGGGTQALVQDLQGAVANPRSSTAASAPTRLVSSASSTFALSTAPCTGANPLSSSQRLEHLPSVLPRAVRGHWIHQGTPTRNLLEGQHGATAASVPVQLLIPFPHRTVNPTTSPPFDFDTRALPLPPPLRNTTLYPPLLRLRLLASNRRQILNHSGRVEREVGRAERLWGT